MLSFSSFLSLLTFQDEIYSNKNMEFASSYFLSLSHVLFSLQINSLKQIPINSLSSILEKEATPHYHDYLQFFDIIRSSFFLHSFFLSLSFFISLSFFLS